MRHPHLYRPRHRAPVRAHTSAAPWAVVAVSTAAALLAGWAVPSDVAPRASEPAPLVAVTVDGHQRQVRLPHAHVSRDQVRVRLDELWPDARVRVFADDAAVVETRKQLRVVHDGRSRQVATTSDRVADVLTAAGVSVGHDDLVHVDTGATDGVDRGQLPPGATIRVVRVDRQVRTRTVRVPAPTRVRRSGTLLSGARQVLAAGRAGRRVVRVVAVRHDGRLVSRTRTLVEYRPPVLRRILVGTGVAAPDPSPAEAQAEAMVDVDRDTSGGSWPAVPGAGDRNWAALAECEASGNPRAVNPAGYYGLYQFDVSTWTSVGGSGLPTAASPAEQTYRAQLLYVARGAQPWPVCGRLL